MNETTTIKISKETKKALNKIKKPYHRRYEDIISDLIENYHTSEEIIKLLNLVLKKLEQLEKMQKAIIEHMDSIDSRIDIVLKYKEKNKRAKIMQDFRIWFKQQDDYVCAFCKSHEHLRVTAVIVLNKKIIKIRAICDKCKTRNEFEPPENLYLNNFYNLPKIVASD